MVYYQSMYSYANDHRDSSLNIDHDSAHVWSTTGTHVITTIASCHSRTQLLYMVMIDTLMYIVFGRFAFAVGVALLLLLTLLSPHGISLTPLHSPTRSLLPNDGWLTITIGGF
jgi:hypothetical protein